MPLLTARARPQARSRALERQLDAEKAAAKAAQAEAAEAQRHAAQLEAEASVLRREKLLLDQAEALVETLLGDLRRTEDELREADQRARTASLPPPVHSADAATSTDVPLGTTAAHDEPVDADCAGATPQTPTTPVPRDETPMSQPPSSTRQRQETMHAARIALMASPAKRPPMDALTLRVASERTRPGGGAPPAQGWSTIGSTSGPRDRSDPQLPLGVALLNASPAARK